MINPERLLGGLLKQSLRGGRRRKKKSGLGGLLGGATTGVVGLGALGVAIAAFEHFTQKKTPAGSGPPPMQTPSGGQRTAPPPPPPSPPASARPGSVPSPPPRKEGISEERAKLLIKAMVAAANADGEIDEKEKRAIMSQLEDSGASQEEQELVQRTLASPPSIDSVLARVDSPELANQIYAVSLAAIEVDTEAERDYLAYLKKRLNLDAAVVDKLHEQFEVE